MALESSRTLWAAEWAGYLHLCASCSIYLDPVQIRSYRQVTGWGSLGSFGRSGTNGPIDLRSFLPYNSLMSQRSHKPVAGASPVGSSMRSPRGSSSQQQTAQFGALKASLLYCPRCRVATPTRERLLLVLPSGNLYEYLCMHCGTSTGSKTDTNGSDLAIPGR